MATLRVSRIDDPDQEDTSLQVFRDFLAHLALPISRRIDLDGKVGRHGGKSLFLTGIGANEQCV